MADLGNRYELRYISNNGKYKSTIIFDEEISLSELRDYLKYFLLSASWCKKQVNELLGEED